MEDPRLTGNGPHSRWNQGQPHRAAPGTAQPPWPAGRQSRCWQIQKASPPPDAVPGSRNAPGHTCGATPPWSPQTPVPPSTPADPNAAQKHGSPHSRGRCKAALCLNGTKLRRILPRDEWLGNSVRMASRQKGDLPGTKPSDSAPRGRRILFPGRAKADWDQAEPLRSAAVAPPAPQPVWHTRSASSRWRMPPPSWHIGNKPGGQSPSDRAARRAIRLTGIGFGVSHAGNGGEGVMKLLSCRPARLPRNRAWPYCRGCRDRGLGYIGPYLIWRYL